MLGAMTAFLDGYFAVERAADLAAAHAYDRMKRGPVPSHEIHPRALSRICRFLGQNEVLVSTEFGYLLHIETGVSSEFLGDPAPQGRGEPINFDKPAKPLNCINCGAPATGDTCSYCGTRHV